MKKSRRKTLATECRSLEMSLNGTPLRQMSITEAFKYIKPIPFKMEKPIIVSTVVIEIDSDSDSEAPPQAEFGGAQVKSEYDSKALLDCNQFSGIWSTPKKPKMMTNVPSTSTSPNNNVKTSNILTDSPKSDCSDRTIICSNATSPGKGIYDEDTMPFSSNNSAVTSPINSQAALPGQMNSQEEIADASEYHLAATDINSKGSGVSKRLNFNLNNNDAIGKIKKQKSVTNTSKTTNLNIAGQETGTLEGIKIGTDGMPKINRKRKASTESKNDGLPTNSIVQENLLNTSKKVVVQNKYSGGRDHKNNELESGTDATNTLPENEKKRKIPAELKNNRQNTNKIVSERDVRLGEKDHKNNSSQSSLSTYTIPKKQRKKREEIAPKDDNSSVKENLANTVKKPMIHSDTGLKNGFPLRTTTSQTENCGHNNNEVTRNLEHSTSVQSSPKLSQTIVVSSTSRTIPGIDAHLQRQDQSFRAENLNGVINRLKTKKGISVTPVSTPEENPVIAKNFNHGNETVVTKMIPVPSASRHLSSIKKNEIKPQDTGSNQSMKQSCICQSLPKIIVKQQEIYTPKSSNMHKRTSTSKTNSSAKNVDDQQPCCSKSLEKEKSTQIKENIASPEQNATNKESIPASTKTNYSTPEKQKMTSTTSTRSNSLKRSLSGSPRRRPFGSPGKGSPTKNREIKSLKSKGQQLQVKQLDELVKLFKMVVKNRHLSNLLEVNERQILKKFVTMEDNQKYVVMKLFVWQKLWYNIYDFCKKGQIEVRDDKDIIDIFEYLKEEKFVDTDYKTSASLSELLEKLDVSKVKELMEELKIKPIKTAKIDNIKTILATTSSQTTLFSYRKSFKDIVVDYIEKKIGRAFKIKESIYNVFFNICLLATFTNPDFYKINDYFTAVIHLDAVFPKAPVEEYLVFYSRPKFLDYVKALKLRADLKKRLSNVDKDTKVLGIYHIGEEAYGQLHNLDVDDIDDHNKAPHLKRFTAEHVYSGILSMCCQHIFTKQSGLPNEVKKWLEYLIRKFPSSKHLGKWYQKLIGLHMRHLDVIDYKVAAKLLIKALEDKQSALNEIDKHELGAIGDQLKSSRRHKIAQIYHDRVAEVIPRSIDDNIFPKQWIDSQCIRSEEPGRKRAYILKDNGGMTVRGVERVALDYYAENGYPGGMHCEGSLVKGLLMLFFWDIIYNPTKTIPGTFISKLQSAPLDMFTPYFYTNRKELIDRRLEDIGTGWPEEKLINFAASNWQQHSHERCPIGIIMDVIKDDQTVEVLITVIGRRVLMKIFKRLIQNIRCFGSGMPDLLIWNIDEKRCKFVEVKGENDRLSMRQKLWLKYLQEFGAAIEVCHVHSTGSKRKKN